MKRVAIFASGNGSNAENIFNFFRTSSKIDIACLFCNNPKAYVLERAQKLNLRTYLFNRMDFYQKETVLSILKKENIDFIVLAGFLWLVPENIINQFHNKIINIHPALLPKYGGKGMYGMRVHKAVIDAAEKESGITVHFVNKNYDEGEYILVAKVNIDKDETPETLAAKIHHLEFEFFPKAIENVVINNS